jgi:hypothetical protein
LTQNYFLLRVPDCEYLFSNLNNNLMLLILWIIFPSHKQLMIFMLFFWYEIDFRVGTSFTRLQTNLLTRAFQIDSDQNNETHNLPFGLCLVIFLLWYFNVFIYCVSILIRFIVFISTPVPTLSYIVQRHLERQTYRPSNSWFLEFSHLSNSFVNP